MGSKIIIDGVLDVGVKIHHDGVENPDVGVKFHHDGVENLDVGIKIHHDGVESLEVGQGPYGIPAAAAPPPSA